jgi:CubicO group peptidase (beta-lactamase class C family)
MSPGSDTGAGTAAIANVATALEACAAAFVKQHRLPGASVAVVHEDDLAWCAGIGICDAAAGRTADDATLYRVASVTKTFTGTAIMQLRDEGRLDLDDPVVAHVPELGAAVGVSPIESVTIRRLLSHESGLMGDAPGTDWEGPTYQGSVTANLARAAEIGVRVPPNTQQKYSNMGYQLLGEIVTRVSGRPYAEYVRERILDPLGMSASGFAPLPDALRARMATGYTVRQFSDELSESVAAPECEAEGGLISCVGDLARWVSFQVRKDGGERPGAQVLAESTLAEMHRPRYLGGDPAWELAYGISWYAMRRGDVVWVQHSGDIHGFSSNVCFDREHRVGAIALVNTMASAGELSMQLAAIGRAAVAALPAPIVPPSPMPEQYRDLLGYYGGDNFDGLLRLEWRDGRLTFVDPTRAGWRPKLTATDQPDAFVVDPYVREAGEPCVFHRRVDGRVDSVVLGPTVFRRFDAVY